MSETWKEAERVVRAMVNKDFRVTQLFSDLLIDRSHHSPLKLLLQNFCENIFIERGRVQDEEKARYVPSILLDAFRAILALISSR